MTEKKERSYRGKSKSELKQQRRDRIIAAGVELFGTVGYQKTTIEDLCREAQISTRYFYEHFESRETLLAYLFDETITSARLQVTNSLVDQSLDPIERVVDSARKLFSLFVHDKRRARIVVVESIRVSDNMTTRYRQTQQIWYQTLNMYLSFLEQQEVIPKQKDNHLLAVAIIGAGDELLDKWILDDSISGDTLVDEYVRLVRLIILGLQNA